MKTYDPNLPFNQLPGLPPENDLNTVVILQNCIPARVALAELKGVTDTIPNPSILLRTTGLQEARLSSEIENIVTTTDDLYEALADRSENISPATKEVLSYHQALLMGVGAVKENKILSTNLFCNIASTIQNREMKVRSQPGTRIIDGGTNKTVYTPPEGESIIREKLQNLEKFIHHDSQIDPLVKMALIHYQFEAIHPFTDGNGRTGRIINVLYLIQQGLLTEPVLYLSSYLIGNKNQYYKGLRNITENQEWTEWVLYILNGVIETANLACRRVLEIKNAMEETLAILKSNVPKIATKELVETLFYYPYCKQRFLVENLKISRQTAANYLSQIVKLGLLNAHHRGRDMYYINQRLLNILLT